MYSPPTRQHELDRADHTDHTDHTDQGALSSLNDLDHQLGMEYLSDGLRNLHTRFADIFFFGNNADMFVVF